jgi:chemotaxis family two-component system response regulator Rcp1
LPYLNPLTTLTTPETFPPRSGNERPMGSLRPIDGDSDEESIESRLSRKAGVNPALVLVVEDNRADVFLVERAVEIHKLPVRLRILNDGEEALKYFENADSDPNMPCPDVVLLDLNLPRRSGREVLERVRKAGRCKDVPVIILTSSNSPEDRRETEALGALRYFRKPTSYQEFLKIGEILGDVLKEVTS